MYEYLSMQFVSFIVFIYQSFHINLKNSKYWVALKDFKVYLPRGLQVLSLLTWHVLLLFRFYIWATMYLFDVYGCSRKFLYSMLGWISVLGFVLLFRCFVLFLHVWEPVYIHLYANAYVNLSKPCLF